MDFIEKIKASGAQKGFFVSKNIGKYAIAQASQDKRLTMIQAKEFAKFEEIFSIPIKRLRSNTLLATSIELIKDKLNPLDKPIPILVDVAKLVHNGKEINVKEFFEKLAHECTFEVTNHFNDEEFKSGEVKEYKGSKEWNLREGELFIDNKPVMCIKINTVFNSCMLDPIIKSIFDVNTRGRIAQMEFVNPYTKNRLGISLLEIPSTSLQ